MATTKWFLNKDFAIPFGLAFLLTRFVDSFWLLLAIAVFFMSILHLVEWLLERKNRSLRFPSMDFLILSVLIFFLGRFINSFWLLLAIVVPIVCVLSLMRWLLKRKTESEAEKV